jgi:hypothetical protein
MQHRPLTSAELSTDKADSVVLVAGAGTASGSGSESSSSSSAISRSLVSGRVSSLGAAAGKGAGEEYVAGALTDLLGTCFGVDTVGVEACTGAAEAAPDSRSMYFGEAFLPSKYSAADRAGSIETAGGKMLHQASVFARCRRHHGDVLGLEVLSFAWDDERKGFNTLAHDLVCSCNLILANVECTTGKEAHAALCDWTSAVTPDSARRLTGVGRLVI